MSKNTVRSHPVIALDGPAGAGKSTVAMRVAQALGYVLVDTGALYRAVGVLAQRRRVRTDDVARVEQITMQAVESHALKMVARAGATPIVWIDGEPQTDALRTPEASHAASIVSGYPGVRAALLALQRSFGSDGGVVLEGRDIGTVVFPDAEIKFFITASDTERAHRRHQELLQKDPSSQLSQVLAAVRERDSRDASRDIAPMKPAEDAVVLDTSAMSVEEVVAVVVQAAIGAQTV
ncbi:MAG: (d)CMP kinase [Deltaproteobacteria bacterium]|nr:(d)CMP kinase [Deltaproteobacteria bacterium]